MLAARRRNRLVLTVSLLLLAAACGGGGNSGGGGQTDPAMPPPTNTVSGTVTFQGAPLAGVTVTAFNTNTNAVVQTTTTDASGKYTITGLQTDWDVTPNYQFWPTLPGYAFYPSLGASAVSPSQYQWDPAPQNWFVNNGTSITRAGYNGAFASATGDQGILFTVINFMSMAHQSLTGANFTAFDGGNPLVSLAATGQQVSYVSGDDAAELKGATASGTRFVDNQDGTVSDALTGLAWLKDAGCFTAAPWVSALTDVNQLASGACGLTDGSTAGEWRLPNIVELESMVDVSASNPAVTAGSPFSNVSAGIYWSSTAYYGGDEGTTNAWTIRFSDGRYVNDSSSNVMATSNNAVWAVKGTGGGVIKLQASGAYVPFASGDDGSVRSGAPLPAPRLRDNGDGTVIDTVTGLVWLKQANCINQPWVAAVAAVQALATGHCGLTDGSAAGSWRMPNRREMQSLADRAQNNQADYFDESFISSTNGVTSQMAAFTNFVTFQYYWTSSTDAANTTEAWTVFSCDFGVYDTAKSSTGYTLAVR